MCGVKSPAANVYLMVSSLYPSLFMDKELSDKLFPLSDFFSNLLLEMGYMHIQATKPDTVGELVFLVFNMKCLVFYFIWSA